MISGHELDRPFTFSGIEQDVSMLSASDTTHGDLAGRDIKRWLTKTRSKLPPNATYLALGVGQAGPEVAFARHLGISPERVTMVDRRIPEYTRERLAREFPGAELVQSGIFEYLANPPKKGFSVVGAFGIEYLFEKEKAPETFVAAMPNLVGKDGIVYISFYCGENVDPLWKKSGFEVVRGYEGNWSRLMYVNRG
jgi:hypothetical protein